MTQISREKKRNGNLKKIKNQIETKIKREKIKWRYGESNPGPLACEASALPLSYIPERTKMGKNFSIYSLGRDNGDWVLISLLWTEELGRVVKKK